ncbi:MAG: hypothetical protein V1909_02565 [Candidatus Micrarchaeota archaeon]
MKNAVELQLKGYSISQSVGGPRDVLKKHDEGRAVMSLPRALELGWAYLSAKLKDEPLITGSLAFSSDRGIRNGVFEYTRRDGARIIVDNLKGVDLGKGQVGLIHQTIVKGDFVAGYRNGEIFFNYEVELKPNEIVFTRRSEGIFEIFDLKKLHNGVLMVPDSSGMPYRVSALRGDTGICYSIANGDYAGLVIVEPTKLGIINVNIREMDLSEKAGYFNITTEGPAAAEACFSRFKWDTPLPAEQLRLAHTVEAVMLGKSRS